MKGGISVVAKIGKVLIANATNQVEVHVRVLSFLLTAILCGSSMASSVGLWDHELAALRRHGKALICRTGTNASESIHEDVHPLIGIEITHVSQSDGRLCVAVKAKAPSNETKSTYSPPTEFDLKRDAAVDRVLRRGGL